MTDSNLKLALNMHTKRVQQPMTTPAAEEEEYQAFHYGRVGVKAQFTVGFTKVDGFTEGFAYMDFRGWQHLDQSTGFTLQFLQKKVTLVGRNLQHILELIRQHRITDLIEASPQQYFALPENEPAIQSITIK